MTLGPPAFQAFFPAILQGHPGCSAAVLATWEEVLAEWTFGAHLRCAFLLLFNVQVMLLRRRVAAELRTQEMLVALQGMLLPLLRASASIMVPV